MSYETGSEMDDPFGEEDSDGGEKEAEQETQDDERRRDTREETMKTQRKDDDENDVETKPDQKYIKDVSVNDPLSPKEIAQSLMVEEYHEENPPVPYVSWRNSVSTGRKTTSYELNSDVGSLLEDAQKEFKDQYNTEISLTDLREIALVVGLMNTDDVFEAAEEWGIIYTN